MACRYSLEQQDNGLWSIVDIFTGRPVVYAERELRDIPAEMADLGLWTLNEIDRTQQLVDSLPNPY